MKKKKGAKVMVTERALFQRVDRKLAERGEKLKTNRGWVPGQRNLGSRYFVVDTNRGYITREKVDLESLGRELGALASYEALAPEGKEA